VPAPPEPPIPEPPAPDPPVPVPVPLPPVPVPAPAPPTPVVPEPNPVVVPPEPTLFPLPPLPVPVVAPDNPGIVHGSVRPPHDSRIRTRPTRSVAPCRIEVSPAMTLPAGWSSTNQLRSHAPYVQSCPFRLTARKGSSLHRAQGPRTRAAKYRALRNVHSPLSGFGSVRDGADFFGVPRILFRVGDRRCGAIDHST
jgi:hypothetical protein